MIFAEPALSHENQLEQLKKRGLHIADEAKAWHSLKHLHYYRLANYFAPFYQDASSQRFIAGTAFADIVALYDFDEGLRKLLLEALTRLELSFRAAWSYHLSHELGAHAYLEASFFDKKQNGISKALKKEARRSHEPALRAYYAQYSSPEAPPLWLVCELMSFGQLSKSFQNIQSKRVRKKIAAEYGLPSDIYGSFLNQASHVRNLCAHHARVWNREFTFVFQLPKKRPAGWLKFFDRRVNSQGDRQNRRLYNTLVMLCYLTQQVDDARAWQERLIAFLAAYSDSQHINFLEVDFLEAMGFPPQWHRLALWRNLAERE